MRAGLGCLESYPGVSALNSAYVRLMCTIGGGSSAPSFLHPLITLDNTRSAQPFVSALRRRVCAYKRNHVGNSGSSHLRLGCQRFDGLSVVGL
jgi:hypothetical protein